MAFEWIYRLHVERVYAVCLRLSADAAWAEELTQEVFIRVWQRVDSFREESPFFVWINRLAVNVSLSALRSDRRRSIRLSGVVEEDHPRPEYGRLYQGLSVDLEQAIAALPEQARQVFVLFDIEGYGHEEIARLLDVSPGTSRSQLHRARRLLREALER
jgi:RNA polymerase sigma-70 factor (ECF subfamily)